MMIPSGENIFAWDVDQTRELGQYRAFVIVGVTKSQINCVALIIEFRLITTSGLDKFDDPVHLFVILGSQSLQTLGMVNQLCLCFLSHEINDFGQNPLCRSE